MEFKIVNWNVNSIKSRLELLRELIKKHDPDIIALQEIKCLEENFPHLEFSDLPYNIYISGQKTYNGVAIFSKIRADEVKTSLPESPIPLESRFIEISAQTPMGYCRFISLYVPQGRSPDHEKYQTKLEFYDAVYNYLVDTNNFDEHVFICSDFNIAPFDIDVYDPKKLEGSISVTSKEKEKMRKLLNLPMVDNYRIINPTKQEFSWWDYRGGSFENNKGMRIDSILSKPNSTTRLSKCFIDYDFRTKPKPSDHAPVISIYNIDPL